MATESIPPQHKRFIEDMGILFEESGMPRMAGRIFGWLLMCDPPHQSSAQLAAVVEGSKGSISTMTRLLISRGLANRMTMPGDRNTYYGIVHGAWSEVLERHMSQIADWRKAAERGIRLMESSGAKDIGRLEEMRDIHAFFERELPVLLKRWEQEHIPPTDQTQEPYENA